MKALKTWQQLLGIYLSGIFIQWLYLPRIFKSPNETLYVVGGDGYFIYYNALFHACHGNGTQLAGMNYPWGEYIFLTDSMAIFSMLLNFLNGIGIPACDYVVGIIHLSAILLLPLTAVFLYLIFHRLQVSTIVAFFCSLLICFLSPQLLRFMTHYGLAYPFILPAGIYWYYRFIDTGKFDWYSYLLMAVILFFGLNNPYIAFIVSAFLGLAIIFHFLIHRNKEVLIKGLIFSGITLALIFFIVKFGDPVGDRIKIQWGYFHTAADLNGLFVGESGLFRRWFGDLITLPKVKFESQANIGIVPFFVLILSLIAGLIARIRRRSNWSSKTIKPVIPLLLAATVLFIYAAHFFIGKWGQSFVEENLGFLTMFKAARRFLWTAYFALTITSTLLIDFYFRKYKTKFPKLSFAILFVLFAIWAVDDSQFIRHKFNKPRYKNCFQFDTNKIDKALNDYQINKDEYQAIYVLPKMQGWNGKLYVKAEYISHHYGLIYSFRSGIPTINAMLSRMSVSQTMLSQQFASPPLVEKELLQHIDPNKKILLLKSNKSGIDEGEQYLVNQSTLLHSDKEYNLYSLQPEDVVESDTLRNVRNKYKDLRADFLVEENDHWYYHEPFNEGESPEVFYGSSIAMEEGEPVFVDFAVPDSLFSRSYEFSAWVLVTDRKYSLPQWKIEQFDKDGKLLHKQAFNSRYEDIFYHTWLRVTKNVDIKEQTARIRVSLKNNQTFYMDEVLFKEKNDIVVYKEAKEEKRFLYNNFIIEQ